jgi:hypothetical protein
VNSLIPVNHFPLQCFQQLANMGSLHCNFGSPTSSPIEEQLQPSRPHQFFHLGHHLGTTKPNKRPLQIKKSHCINSNNGMQIYYLCIETKWSMGFLQTISISSLCISFARAGRHCLVASGGGAGFLVRHKLDKVQATFRKNEA